MATPRNERTSRALRTTARAALEEDRWRDDATSRAVIPRSRMGVGVVTAQAAGVVSGIPVATAVAQVAGLRVRGHLSDGDRVRPGTVVLELRGSARAILAVERTMLNYLMHLSGVATATAKAREAVGRSGPGIWGTRKTVPGLRDLEKAAIEHGGGSRHRRDLSDGILVKNNHLALVPLSGAIRSARATAKGRRVQVEVRTLSQARAAVTAGATALLIDNVSPEDARRLLKGLATAGLRTGVHVEISGGITPENARAYRRTGADALSLGALTHSAPALPFHLTLTPWRE